MRPLENLEDRRMMSVSLIAVGDFLSINGSSGSDQITVNDGGSTSLVVKEGNTTIGTAWNIKKVRIQTFSGADYVYINSGKTSVQFDIELGIGDDSIEPGYGKHWIKGGDGLDTVSYSKFGTALFLSNSGNDYSGYLNSVRDDLIYADVEHMRGGSGNDQMFGNSGMNRLYGGPGNDQLYGGAGMDFLLGETGNDTLNGGIGSDHMWGGAHNDTFYSNDGEPDWIVGDNAYNQNAFNSYDVVWGDWSDSYDSVEKVNLPIFIFHP